ncbi:hypothetical protein J2T17_002121 [Paenibacillus mucilaginosus]
MKAWMGLTMTALKPENGAPSYERSLESQHRCFDVESHPILVHRPPNRSLRVNPTLGN